LPLNRALIGREDPSIVSRSVVYEEFARVGVRKAA
jgi:hypothetical protein